MRLALLGLVCACRATGEFHCEMHEQCRNGDEIGFCEPSGYCTLTDTTCPTQRRYVHASPELDGACLENAVTGRIVERSVVNDDMGRPVVNERLPTRADLAMTVQLEDASAPAVDYRELDGAFSFPVPTGARYQVSYVLDGWHALQHDVPHLQLGRTTVGRLDRTPVTKQTMLQFSQLPAMVGQVFIASTGIWTETAHGSASSMTGFNWQNAVPLSGSLGLLEADKNDRVHFLMFGQLDGYATLTAHSAYQVTQTDGVSTMVTGLLTTVSERDQCIALDRRAASDVARLKMVHTNVTSTADEWSVLAAPARASSYAGSFRLATDSATASTDGTVMARFVNPFPGTELLAHQVTGGTIPIAAPGLGPTSVSIAVNTYAAIDAADASCASAARLEATAALGGSFKIGPTRIDADNKPVDLPNGPFAELTWDHVVDGPADMYSVILWELINDGADGTTMAARWGWETATRRLFVDKTLLTSKSTYVLAVYTVLGAPNAATGDMVTVSYPYQVNVAWSRTFTIN